MATAAKMIDRFLPFFAFIMLVSPILMYTKDGRWSLENGLRFVLIFAFVSLVGRQVGSSLIKRRDPDFLIGFGAMVHFFGFGAAFMWSDAHSVPLWSQATGYLFYLAFVCTWFWAMKQHENKVSLSYAGSHDEPPPSFTTTGPYTIIRHPIYFSYGLQWVATFFLSQLLLILPLALIHLSIFSYYARLEEAQFLSSKLSKSYRDYMRAVPYRIMPFIPFL